MPANRNSSVVELLRWHGHDSGGVRVPFGEFGDPLGHVLETDILRRLQETAAAIANGAPAPRWLFLVGGPGNGKSQMVEEFVRALDSAADLKGALVDVVRSKFAGIPTPRIVDVAPADVPSSVADRFAESFGRLAIIQDASATDEPARDAAENLVLELSGLLADASPPGATVPVVVCCVNRGLLARAVIAARDDEVVRGLFEALTRATGLGEEALARSRPGCWPVEIPHVVEAVPALLDLVACWPMDMESLLLAYEADQAPAGQILREATAPHRWEDGSCGDCNSQNACPFLQNAKWLRNPDQSIGLQRILRREELASGQRWNFRSIFSLIAELVVGERDDFADGGTQPEHPCDWVHGRVSQLSGAEVAESIGGAVDLVRRLYPHALYVTELPPPARELAELPDTAEATTALLQQASTQPSNGRTSIRRRLAGVVRPIMDPAQWSPEDESDPLYILEDAYSQSVSLGNSFWPEVAPAEAEQRLLNWLVQAEAEADEISSEQPARSSAAQRYLRMLAATIAKRSVATRLGRHAGERDLADYEVTIRDVDRLSDLQDTLKDLLSGRNFRANALAAFGQAEDPDGALVVLVSNPVSIFPIRPAPDQHRELPAHDLPAIPVARRDIPLTFDLFLALRLRRRGCSSGTMPASVRASLDRIKQLYAGEVCRQERGFLAGNAFFEIDGLGRVVLVAEGSPPRFTSTHAR